MLAQGRAATLACPPGPEWTRERQQLPPVIEPAPVVGVRLEREDLAVQSSRPGVWSLDRSEVYALMCSYAEGPDSAVIVTGVRRLRVRDRGVRDRGVRGPR